MSKETSTPQCRTVELTPDEIQAIVTLLETASVSGLGAMEMVIGLHRKLTATENAPKE